MPKTTYVKKESLDDILNDLDIEVLNLDEDKTNTENLNNLYKLKIEIANLPDIIDRLVNNGHATNKDALKREISNEIKDFEDQLKKALRNVLKDNNDKKVIEDNVAIFKNKVKEAMQPHKNKPNSDEGIELPTIRKR